MMNIFFDLSFNSNMFGTCIKFPHQMYIVQYMQHRDLHAFPCTLRPQPFFHPSSFFPLMAHKAAPPFKVEIFCICWIWLSAPL